MLSGGEGRTRYERLRGRLGHKEEPATSKEEQGRNKKKMEDRR